MQNSELHGATPHFSGVDLPDVGAARAGGKGHHVVRARSLCGTMHARRAVEPDDFRVARWGERRLRAMKIGTLRLSHAVLWEEELTVMKTRISDDANQRLRAKANIAVESGLWSRSELAPLLNLTAGGLLRFLKGDVGIGLDRAIRLAELFRGRAGSPDVSGIEIAPISESARQRLTKEHAKAEPALRHPREEQREMRLELRKALKKRFRGRAADMARDLEMTTKGLKRVLDGGGLSSAEMASFRAFLHPAPLAVVPTARPNVPAHPHGPKEPTHVRMTETERKLEMWNEAPEAPSGGHQTAAELVESWSTDAIAYVLQRAMTEEAAAT